MNLPLPETPESHPETHNGLDVALERITCLASRVLHTTGAAIFFGVSKKQSILASFGLNPQHAQELCEICAQAMPSEEVLVIPDLSNDSRFTGNPMANPTASGELNIRFLAAAPVRVTGEYEAGSLVVFDGSTHPFGDNEVALLAELAAVASDEVELHEKNLALEREKAQARSREREYRTMVENATDVIARTDTQLRYLFISPSVEQVTGIPPSEYVGKTIRELGLSDELVNYWEQKRLQILATGQSSTLEFSYQAPDGKTFYFESLAIPEFGPYGTIESVLSIARDVTSRKGAELELERQREILQTIFDHIPVMIDFYDSNNKLHLVNREWERVTGWTMEEVMNHPNFMEELYPDPKYREYAIRQMQQAGGEWQDARTRVRSGDSVDISWKNLRLPDGTNIGFGLDVTERRRKEEEQAHFVAILEATSDFVAFADATRHVSYINRAGRQMIGMDPDEDTSHTVIADYYPSQNSPSLSEGLPTAIRDGIWMGESTLLKRDGQELAISQVMIAHRTPEGEIDFYSTIARDITPHKQAEEALRFAKQEADQANEAKSEFLSRMSHELRTPLNAILGFSQLFDKDTLTPRNAENVEQIVKAGRHLLALINEVLDVASIDAGRLTLSLEAILVQDVAREVLLLMKPLADERGIQFKNLIVDDSYVRADLQRFKQILLNLVSNAVKYNRDGGTVSVATEVEGRSLRFLVTDTGEGIPSSDFEKLFTPFERLSADKRGIEGSGIGLVLSKRLVELMGGTIGVESTPGQGTTFWISLPLEENPLNRLVGNELNSAARQLDEGPEPKRCMIYIEDNLSNLKLVERILMHRPDFRLMAAMRGDLGLDLVREHLPALILLDLHLPGMAGDEVLAQLQADPQTRSIPVIMISADTTPKQIQRMLEAGARDYLTKPLNVRQLLQIVDRIVNDEGDKEQKG